MIKYHHGKIVLEKIVIDLANYQKRPKVTEKELEGYYDEFIDHAPEIKGYFEDEKVFLRVLEDIAGEKRPKIIPRDPSFSLISGIKNFFYLMTDPGKIRTYKNHFRTSRMKSIIRYKIPSDDKKTKDPKETRDIKEFEDKFPGYEGIIEIISDLRKPMAKCTLFHEGTHYLISRYQEITQKTFSKKDLVDIFADEKAKQLEFFVNEAATIKLSDLLLNHDKDAQFENRWDDYLIKGTIPNLSYLASGFAAGFCVYMSFNNPYLLPLIAVPGRIRDNIMELHKQSIRERLMRPIEYPKFKI